MTKQLIVNADDFGFTRGVNRGIIRAFREGILTSATVMANGDAFDDAVELARANPGLAIGCHLVIVGGRPVAPARDVPSLVGGDGRLPATLTDLLIKLARRRVRAEEIEREFRAQVERVIGAGLRPSHFDTHKHSHTHLLVCEALARVAREFGVRCVRNPFENPFASSIKGPAARASRKAYLKQRAMAAVVAPRAARFRKLAREHGLRTPDYFRGVGLTGLIDAEALCGVIASLSDGATEMMCHPGIYDDELERSPTRLKRERERELEALVDARVRRSVDELNVKLINYLELAKDHVRQ